MGLAEIITTYRRLGIITSGVPRERTQKYFSSRNCEATRIIRPRGDVWQHSRSSKENPERETISENWDSEDWES